MAPRSLVILAYVAISGYALAADAPGKPLDKFQTLDPKTTAQWDEIKAKVISTPDPAHPKVLEITSNFPKPDAWPQFAKLFRPGTLNPKLFSGIRFHAKTDNDSKMFVAALGDEPGPDGRPLDVSTKWLPITSQWTQIYIPFTDFKFYKGAIVKNGVRKEYPGDIVISDSDLLKITRLKFVFPIQGRGNDGTSRVLIDNLELVQK